MTTTSASRPINSTETTFSYAAAASGKNSAGSSTVNKSQTSGSPKPNFPSTGPPPTQRPVSSTSSTAQNMNGSTAPTTRTSTPPTTVADSHPKMNGDTSSTAISSTVSSPNLGTTSSSMLVREEDSVASISSVSEDKTGSWEKQSQTSSHTENKSSSTGSRTPDVSKATDLVPATPVVNFWKVRSEIIAAKKSGPPPAVPVPVAAKTPAGPSNATAAKDNEDKLMELKQAEKKKKQIGENSDVSDKEKSKEGSSGVGRDIATREFRDRKKSMDAGRVNGFAGKEDGGAPRKSVRRAHQQPEKEPITPILPPPVTDTESWPTPEIAQDEVEKAKREKDEKDKTASSGVRAGSKWVPVPITTPYVPPFPSKTGRGGRTSRGGRESGSRGGAGAISSSSAPNGDKHTGGALGASGAENDRGRQGSGVGAPRGGYQGSRGNRRATSAGGTAQRRESRGSLHIPPVEKRKDLTAPETGEPVAESVQSAKTSSTGTQTHTERLRHGSRGDESSSVTQGDARQFSENQDRTHQSNNGHGYHGRQERSYQTFNSNRSDHHGITGTASTHIHRERGSEGGRGRGGFSRRNNYYNSQYSNGHSGGHHQNPGSHFTSTPQHFNSHPANGQYQPQGSQTSQRAFRGGSRSHQGPNTGFSRFPNPNMQPPPIFMQPYPAPYDYGMMSPNGIPVPMELPGMAEIITQINYYFSVDNLCKDMFLRKHMDNDGYVRLSFIASFNRIMNLTQDINLLREACLQSQEVQIATGIDDFHIRKAVGWETWILNEAERDPAAQCGQSNWQIDHHQHHQQNSNSGSPLEMSGSAAPFMPDPSRSRAQSVIAPGAPPFVPSGNYPSVFSATPLSANVPEFSPSTVPFLNGSMDNSGSSIPNDEFSDEDINRLVVVCKRHGNGESNNTSPVASPAKPRANGIPDTATVNGVLTNGTTSGPSSPNKASFGQRTSDVGWLLTEDSQGSTESQEKFVHKLYPHVLTQSLRQREISGPSRTSEMATLYKFWSHFLCSKFNGQMYNEFKACALGDADLSVRYGLECLFKFYEESLKERENFHISLIQDFVTLVKKDARNGHQLGSDKLKSLLSNSRLSTENKFNLEAFIDSEVHSFLENGVQEKDGQIVEFYAT